MTHLASKAKALRLRGLVQITDPESKAKWVHFARYWLGRNIAIRPEWQWLRSNTRASAAPGHSTPTCSFIGRPAGSQPAVECAATHGPDSSRNLPSAPFVYRWICPLPQGVGGGSRRKTALGPHMATRIWRPQHKLGGGPSLEDSSQSRKDEVLPPKSSTLGGPEGLSSVWQMRDAEPMLMGCKTSPNVPIYFIF